MKNIILVAAMTLSSWNTLAQDSVLLSPKWQRIFFNATRLEYIPFKFDDYDKRFQLGELYDGLIIFKDSSKQSLELSILYSGIDDLCDATKPIRGKDLKIPRGYEIAKKDIQYFVFQDLIFALDVTRKDYAISLSDNKYWSALLIDGPVRFTKSYYIRKMESGSVLEIDAGNIQKGETRIGSDPDNLGGFGFKKFASKTFSDCEELSGKIAAEENGYTRKDALKIILEYNDWAKQQDPTTYHESLLMKKFLNEKFRNY